MLFKGRSEMDGIQGMDQIERPCHDGGLAALHVTDHVPADGAGFVHGLYLRALFHGFLDVIFAEVDLSEITDSRYHGGGMEF